MNARAIVGMIQPTFVTYEEGSEKIRAMMARAKSAGIPFYVETHRGTITQDLQLTGRWASSIPDIRMHPDLSHFVISYEVGSEPRRKIREVFDSVLAKCGMIDGRIGNGQQVQIDIGSKGDTVEARRFAKWWKQGMVAWLKQAKPGDIFVFKSELGPPGYTLSLKLKDHDEEKSAELAEKAKQYFRSALTRFELHLESGGPFDQRIYFRAFEAASRLEDYKTALGYLDRYEKSAKLSGDEKARVEKYRARAKSQLQKNSGRKGDEGT